MELLFIPLVMLYLYKCAVKTDEGWHKNIVTLGRWTKTFSGARDRVARKDGKLVPGKNRKKIRWILFGIQWVSRYKFPWVQGMQPDEMSEKGIRKSAIVWGDPESDSEVAVQRNEWTRRHRDQFDYLFSINDLETGEKLKVKKLKGEKLEQGATASNDDADAIENIKINSLLNATVKMDSPYKAEFKAGGAIWYTSLKATLTGLLGEVLSGTVFADLPALRGDGLKNALVENRYPKVFLDQQGNPLEKVKFIDLVNHEMLVVKDLGVYLLHVTLMDFEVTPDYLPFLTALQMRAISIVNLDSAKKNAEALKAGLDVKKEFVNDLVITKTNQDIRLKTTVDPNIKEKYSHLKNLRMYSEGTATTPSSAPLDFNGIVNTAIGLEVAGDLDPLVSDAAETDSAKKQDSKKNTQKKGGKK